MIALEDPNITSGALLLVVEASTLLATMRKTATGVLRFTTTFSHPVGTNKRWSYVVSVLGQRLRRSPSSETTSELG